MQEDCTTSSYKPQQEEYKLNKKDMTVHELEIKAASVKYELDKLNRAAYGMTFDEVIKTLGRDSETEKSAP